MEYQCDLLQRHLAYKLGYSWVVVEGVVAETFDLLALDVLETFEDQKCN